MAHAWQEQWTRRFYQSQPGWKNGTTEFHDLCREHAPPHARIVEIGAGPTNPTSAFLASLGELYGVDVSDEVTGNVHLSASSLIVDGHFAHPDSSFDLAVSNYVVEHVPNTREHLSEIHRVLKPGGHYVFRTPNLFHYVALVSRVTSHRLHTLVANRLRNHPADHHEPWPTVYAMNTPEAVRRYARLAGLHVKSIAMVEKEPSYGMYGRPLYLAFMAYERTVNASKRLASLRANMFVVLQKE